MWETWLNENQGAGAALMKNLITADWFSDKGKLLAVGLFNVMPRCQFFLVRLKEKGGDWDGNDLFVIQVALCTDCKLQMTPCCKPQDSPGPLAPLILAWPDAREQASPLLIVSVQRGDTGVLFVFSIQFLCIIAALLSFESNGLYSLASQL